MEIEILTTKKKLTKSIIKQLKPATASQIELFVNIPSLKGYHVRGLGSSYDDNVGLFQAGNGDWVLMGIRDWYISKSETKVYARLKGKWSSEKEFGTKEERDSWLKIYNEAKSRMMKNHLII